MRRSLRLGLIVGLVGLILLSSLPVGAEEVKIIAGGIPFGILGRVFPFKYKNSTGTCFVIDIDGRQYVIAAKHCAPGIKNGDSVQLHMKNEWFTFVIRPIFPLNEKTDIVALAADRLIVPKMEILVGAGDMILGQTAYFLGFPHLPPTPYLALSTKFQEWHLPFIKNATISTLELNPDDGNILYLDGHNNPGFSGGPVIIANHHKQETLQIVGVVSGYANQNIPVQLAELKESPSEDQKMGKETKLIPYVPENSGIIVAYSIIEIIKAIGANPIGLPLPQSNR